MTTIAVYPFILHRNEDIYPDAEEFIPERFLDEENKAKFQFGYLPFSAGARNCIGMIAFILLFNFVYNLGTYLCHQIMNNQDRRKEYNLCNVSNLQNGPGKIDDF